MFFTFEVLSCLTGSGKNQCTNTLKGVKWLSSFLDIETVLSIIHYAVPKVVRDEVSLTKSQLATLRVNKKEILQKILLTGVVASALVLLSSLGVPNNPTDTIDVCGLIGFACFLNHFLIQALALLKVNEAHLEGIKSGSNQRLTHEMPNNRRLSSGVLGEVMSLGDLV